MIQSTSNRTVVWLKWSGWLTVAWVSGLVIRDVPMIFSLGYPRWFLLEFTLNGLSGILEGLICLLIAGVATLVASLVSRNSSSLWGATTPFRYGLAWSLGVGVLLGLLMVTQRHG